MIMIQQYRTAIGNFHTTAIKIQHLNLIGKELNPDHLYDAFVHLQHCYSKCIYQHLLVMSGIYEELFLQCIKLKLLILSNNIETNPGPFFVKQIQGSFHQGHQTFSSSAGNQCASIGLFALSFSEIKSVSHWTPQNIDAIIEYGDQLYKSLNLDRFLEPQDLPVTVNIHSIEVHHQFTYFHQAFLENSIQSKACWRNLLDEHFKKHALLWIGQNTVTLIKGGNSICLFDSHSWDCNGKISDNGLSILMTFSNSTTLLDYISDTYFQETDRTGLLVKIQFMLVHTNSSSTQHANLCKKFKPSAFSHEKPKPRVVHKRKFCETAERESQQCSDNQNVLGDQKQYRCIDQFKEKLKQGPLYICTVCHRIMYKKTVRLLIPSKYERKDLFTAKLSFDQREYICRTCHNKISKNQMPSQAVHNKLELEDIPSELNSLHKLETILIAQRICFQKIIIMPKGQQRKIKGAVCNIPVECDTTCNMLPRPPSALGMIMLKLKRKLEYRGHVYFQSVRPKLLLHALAFLKENNHLYANVDINMETIPSELLELETNEHSSTASNYSSVLSIQNCNEVGNSMLPSEDFEPENEDPLNQYRNQTAETCLQSYLPCSSITNTPQNLSDTNSGLSGNEITSIAPGENKCHIPFMLDKNCKELSFPVLFPTGRFGFQCERDVKLSPVKYVNARLLNYTGRFASNSEYLFLMQYIVEHKKSLIPSTLP